MVTDNETDIAFLLLDETEINFQAKVKELRNRVKQSHSIVQSNIVKFKVYQGKTKEES